MKGKRVGIFTPPLGKAGLAPLSNLIDLISSVSNNISIISGNEKLSCTKNKNIYQYKFFLHSRSKSQFSRFLNFFYLQMRISLYFLKYNKHVDLWLFFLGGDIYILPLTLTKLLNKPIICVLSSSPSLMLSHEGYHKFFKFFEKISYSFVEKIIIYSPRLITEWSLTPYRHKILIAHEHFLDFNTFTVTTPYKDRPPLIGYIGRLSAEKGVQHFAQALPAILSEQQDLRVFIGGDGQLKESIETSLDAEKITARIDLPGWISHDDLPKYLNQLRLLVLPSYTEGLPNIMLEAMACGTPVLATPVGAIPDVIRDGETGFIMEDNSPECIALNVMRALQDPDLDGVVERGRRYVEGEFTFEKAVERWRGILENFN